MEQQVQACGVVTKKDLDELKISISKIVSDFTKKTGFVIKVKADTSFYKLYWSGQNNEISSQITVEIIP